MNWLAHIFLSPPEIDFQIGNLLADLGKARMHELFIGEETRVAARRVGQQLHHIIDRFTDTHTLFLKSQSRLYREGQSGRLRGVVVDLVYDHLLTRFWDRYANVSINTFLEQFYQKVITVIKHPLGLPE